MGSDDNPFPDRDASDGEGQAALATLESAAVPDVTDNSYQAQVAALEEYAQTAFNEVLAQYRFLGLLAGIKGPNDSQEDVDAARAAVMEALEEVLKAGPLAEQVNAGWDAVLQQKDALQERIFEGLRAGGDSDALMSAQGLLDEIVKGHPHDQYEGTLEQIGSGAYRPNYDSQLEYVPPELRGDFSKLMDAQERLAVLEDARRAERRAAVVNFFRRIWDGVKNYYEENMALIRNGQWLLATGRIAVDAAIFAAEEVVVAGIVTAIIGVTGGMAAGIAIVLRSAVRAMLSVVRTGTRVVRNVRASYVFKIELRKVEPGVLYSNPIPFNVTVSRKLDYHKEIDVETDLTPDERSAVGEGGQGSLEPDADAPESGSAGGREHAKARDEDGDEAGSQRLPEKRIDCFSVPRNVDPDEFRRQLAEQQATINNMTADDVAYAHAVLDQARRTWRESGQKGSFTKLIRGNGQAQRAAREQYAQQLEASGLAEDAIEEIMSGLDATHYLDIIAGGDPDHVGMGGSNENQRIGPAWAQANTLTGVSRADQLRNEADAMRAAGLHDQKMRHVKLC